MQQHYYQLATKKKKKCDEKKSEQLGAIKNTIIITHGKILKADLHAQA